jgi:sugar lactone lactonase YvrE
MLLIPVVALVAVAAAAPASAHRPPPSPKVTDLVSFGSGLGSGSTVGPDGALYVTDGNAGSVLRVDPESGDVSTFAEGLPPQVLGIGGAMDVVFIGHTAYVLVTMVGGDLLLPTGIVHFGDATVGIYRLEQDGTFTVIADIGAWAVANPPPNTDYFITTGVQYALQTYRGGFLVTDGHHNRVLRVTLDGEVSERIAFGDIVPTGLEASGRTVYLAEAGPVPHNPQDAKVVALTPKSPSVTEVASGDIADDAGLAVDVEMGRGHQLYALLQGDWTWPNVPENAGLPASPNTGELVKIEKDGTFTTIVDDLDRPTSLEFIGDTAFVITLTGTIIRIDHVSSPAHAG